MDNLTSRVFFFLRNSHSVLDFDGSVLWRPMRVRFLPSLAATAVSMRKIGVGQVQVVPLLTCNRDISRHKSSFPINGVENEVELLLARASIYAPPRNVETWTICPQHRASLGVSWKRPSTKCSIPVSLSKHDIAVGKKPKAERGLSKLGSQFVLKETGIFLPVGAGELFVYVFITKVPFMYLR